MVNLNRRRVVNLNRPQVVSLNRREVVNLTGACMLVSIHPSKLFKIVWNISTFMFHVLKVSS